MSSKPNRGSHSRGTSHLSLTARSRVLSFLFPWLTLAIASVGASSARAETALDLSAYRQQAGTIFNADVIGGSASSMMGACDTLLLAMQALSITIIIAGLLMKLRKDHEQMEGIASMLLKVGFIATLPLWRTFALDAAETVADSVGTQAVQARGSASPLMVKMWGLAGQWMPPQSPYLDALDSQNSQDLPTSGSEQAWSMRAWNWARGVTATTTNTFAELWHAASGSLRALVVLGCCGAMTCLSLLTVFAVYLSGIIRFLIYHFGCALLPVFIASLGVDALRSQSTRFVLGLASIACWPIGWAVTNIVTSVLLTGISTWMTQLTASAVGLPTSAANLPSVAMAAPFLAWGVLFLFVALTVVLCGWWLGSLVLGPLAITKAVASGVHVAGGFMGASLSHLTSTVTTMAPCPTPLAQQNTLASRARPSALPPTSSNQGRSQTAVSHRPEISRAPLPTAIAARSTASRACSWLPPARIPAPVRHAATVVSPFKPGPN